MSGFSQIEQQNLPIVISNPRLSTYLVTCNRNVDHALSLYQWNMQISAAFMVPLHVCEIAIRNGVVEAIESVYGQSWHLNRHFQKTLPNPTRGYNPSLDLAHNSQAHANPGKVVAGLKFAFWEKMLTARHDMPIWSHHFKTAFPGSDQNMPIHSLRGEAYNSVSAIRSFRNRIAHHEPVYARCLLDDFDLIMKMIMWRSKEAARWVDRIQTVTTLLKVLP